MKKTGIMLVCCCDLEYNIYENSKEKFSIHL